MDTFSARQEAAIQSHIADFERRFHTSLTTIEPRFLDIKLRGVVMPELEDMQASLGDIQTAIVQLDWYWRVNQEALRRISDKRKLVTREPSPYEMSSAAEGAELWGSKLLSKLLACVNQFRCAVCTVLTEAGSLPRLQHSVILAWHPFRKKHFNWPQGAYGAVTADNQAALGSVLRRIQDEMSNDDQALLADALLQLAVQYQSLTCFALLLPLSSPFPASQATSQPNKYTDYLHRIIVQVGRQRRLLDKLNHMIQRLDESERWMLSHADQFGCLPLHYAAEHGLACVCRTILSSMGTWGWPYSLRRQVMFTRDARGETPLDLAVRLGHASAVQVLLEQEAAAIPQDLVENDTASSALFTAIQAGFEDIFLTLLSQGRGLHHYRNGKGETAVYLAARHGRAAMLRALLQAAADPNLAETLRGWTPLMAAAIQGHHQVFEILVQAGVDQDARDDDRGWTALDHAAYKGYPAMMKMLRRQVAPQPDLPSRSTCPSRNRTLPTATAPWLDNNTSTPLSYVFVHPGTLDVYEKVAVIDISPHQSEVAPAVIPETSLFLEISSLEPSSRREPATQSAPGFSQLPILDDWSNRPWVFATRDPLNAKVVFRLFSALAGKDTGPIGTAIALLSSLRRVLGSGRESLIRYHTIPFLGPRGNLVGTVTFTFMVAEAPVRLPVRPPPTAPQQLGSHDSTLIGAHRGKVNAMVNRLPAYFYARPGSKRQSTCASSDWRKYNAGTVISSSP